MGANPTIPAIGSEITQSGASFASSRTSRDSSDLSLQNIEGTVSGN